MTKYVDIKVTTEDVKRGMRQSTTSCPLARAAQRMFPFADISAGSYSIYIENQCYMYSNPLNKEVDRFDEYGLFTPRTYRIFKDEE